MKQLIAILNSNVEGSNNDSLLAWSLAFIAATVHTFIHGIEFANYIERLIVAASVGFITAFFGLLAKPLFVWCEKRFLAWWKKKKHK